MISQNFRSAILLSLIVILIPLVVLGQSTVTGLTPMDVAKIEQVDEIVLGPSGQKAVYTLQVQADPRKVNKPASYHLYLADLATGNSIPYVTTMSVSDIAIRPKHNTITFVASRSTDQPKGIYEMSMTGGEAQRILSFPTSVADYSWGPDGNHLAFMAEDTVKEEKSPLPYEPEIYEENLKQRRGYVTNIAKEEHQPHQLQVEGSIYQMHWSPDGSKLAIAAAPTPMVDDYYMSQQVMIVDHHGKEVFAKVDHEGKLGQVAWSPDGKRLALLGGADIHDPIAGRLFIVSANDGSTTQLQPDYQGMFEQIKWTGNNTLHYLTSEGVWSTYGSINADETDRKTIIDKGGPYLESFERSSDGSTIFTASTPKHPTELYQLTEKSEQVKRITNSNPWLDNRTFGRQEVVKWKAEDGTELQGILIFPVDFQKGQKYPMITTVHGGPESHYDNGWVTSYDDAGQVGAAQGYVVFYPNYRGSTGRGETFLKSSQGDMAGAEFDDIVAGVDQLVNEGIADGEKVGVTGGSYGGYATGWMATRYTDKFAAGVMFVGISNNISKWGTSDIPEELFLVHARERIWEDYQGFLERSPIYYAGQAKTPLLIMAGKEDTRVDPGQSYELYRHIKTRTDTPVRLVLYPGEGHGNAKSTARFDYNLRMMRWFGEYLKGEKGARPDDELDLENMTIEN